MTSVGGHIFIYGPIQPSVEQINNTTGSSPQSCPTLRSIIKFGH
jgi:hypothetical protein